MKKILSTAITLSFMTIAVCASRADGCPVPYEQNAFDAVGTVALVVFLLCSLVLAGANLIDSFLDE